ncbi:hypothetical protein KKB18_09440 [bacterium]|nr:hypothetical protein [bacterium]
MKKYCAYSLVLILGLSLMACTAGHTTILPPTSEIFITTGDINEPYTPLGLVSGQSRGFQLFIVPIGPSIDEARDMMLEQARALDANAVINVNFYVEKGLGPLWRFPKACVQGLAVKRN